MKIEDCLRKQIESDLGINIKYQKGLTDTPVSNCWHFSTDGNSVDALFWDDDDFIDGMNRTAILSNEFKVIILAFALMGNHIHFILYGSWEECNGFIHEYVRRTSIRIAHRHNERHKLNRISINGKSIDTSGYLKTAICYVLRNPVVAGLPVLPCDYPWSSASLMFRNFGQWSSPGWMSSQCRTPSYQNQAGRIPRSRSAWNPEWTLMGDMIFPGEYVAADVVESLFRSHKAFSFHMGMNKESEVEAMEGRIARLSIPDQEMRQHKNELCRELFGGEGHGRLNTSQRMHLAKSMKKKYQSSTKQIARICGLVYDEVKDLI